MDALIQRFNFFICIGENKVVDLHYILIPVHLRSHERDPRPVLES